MLGLRETLTTVGINLLRKMLPPETVEIRLKAKESLRGPVKILGINASLRGNEGFTSTMLHDFLKQAKEFGAEVELIHLAEKSICHCEGCASRDDSECTFPCIHQDDDTNSVLEKIISANAYVFGSPTYWGGVSSHLQVLLEKMNAIEVNHYAICLERDGKEPLLGKPAAFLNSQDGEGAALVLSRLSWALSHMGIWVLPDAMIFKPVIVNRPIARLGMAVINERKFEWISNSLSKAARNLVLVADRLRDYQWDSYSVLEPPC